MIIHKKIDFKITLVDLKKALGLMLVVVLFVSGLFVFAEPGMTHAASATATVVVTLTVDAGIALTVNSAISAMAPNISVSQDTSVGTSTFTVKTNSVGGYTMTVQASTTAPAMQTAAAVGIPDATATPTVCASIPCSALIPSGAYAFGFSAYSTSTATVPSATWGTQTTGCASATGVPSTGLKYRGFNGATPITIATYSSTTTTAGNPIVVCFFAAQNGSYIPSGSYTATITGTATTQ